MTETHDDSMEAIADVVAERLEQFEQASGERAEEIKVALLAEVHERFAKMKTDQQEWAANFEKRLPTILGPILEPFKPEKDYQTAAIAQAAVEAMDRVQYQKPPEFKPTDVSGIEKGLKDLAAAFKTFTGALEKQQDLFMNTVKELMETLAKKTEQKERHITIKHGKDESTATIKAK